MKNLWERFRFYVAVSIMGEALPSYGHIWPQTNTATQRFPQYAPWRSSRSCHQSENGII